MTPPARPDNGWNNGSTIACHAECPLRGGCACTSESLQFTLGPAGFEQIDAAVTVDVISARRSGNFNFFLKIFGFQGKTVTTDANFRWCRHFLAADICTAALFAYNGTNSDRPSELAD